MLGHCNSCGSSIFRYLRADSKDPCEYCGGVIFRLIHLGLPFPYNIPQHEILFNVETKELLSHDLCSDYFPRGEDEVRKV